MPRHGRTSTGAFALAAIFAFVVMVSPSLVYATAWSSLSYSFGLTPPGEPATNLCQKAGSVDTALAGGIVETFVKIGGSGNCSGTTNAVPAGWLGQNVKGYRDGAYCGQSGYRYTTSSAWLYSIQPALCANPAGVQSFWSSVIGVLWGGSGYWSGATTPSPAQNY